MQCDYLIVGSGLTGATIARALKDSGASVLVIDRRSHLGGNVHDQHHESGIRFHTYGPHYFRTSSEKIWKFVNRFSGFYAYEAVLKSYVDNAYENWPIAASYIRKNIGEVWTPDFKGKPQNFEEASLSIMPRLIYEKFVKGYTEKQWGIAANMLSADLAKRFDVHLDDDPRLKSSKYQGIPINGYAEFMRAMLEEIPVILNADYLRSKEHFTATKKIIFTGPIDEYFDFDLGKLTYRGQIREHSFLADIDFSMPCGQVNYPDSSQHNHIRILEWKHMLSEEYKTSIKGTLLTMETPHTPEDPDQYEYPFPDSINAQLYKKYRERAEQIPNLIICGRLGEYQYYDMDQAIARAFAVTNKILKREVVEA
jgi:UDP-galactopyranose mutase